MSDFITFVREQINANKFEVSSKWVGRKQYTVIYGAEANFMLYVKTGMFSWLFKRMCLQRFYNNRFIIININRAESKLLYASYKYALEENKRRANKNNSNLEELGDKLRNLVV